MAIKEKTVQILVSGGSELDELLHTAIEQLHAFEDTMNKINQASLSIETVKVAGQKKQSRR